jgi:hypothetical protein
VVEIPTVGICEIEVFPAYVVVDKNDGHFQVNLTSKELKMVQAWEKLDDGVQELLKRKFEEQQEKVQLRAEYQNRDR